MLEQIRRFRHSFAAKIFLLAVAASFFIGFGVLSAVRNDPSVNATIVAHVDGDAIPRRDLNNAINSMVERYRQELGEQFDRDMLDELPLEEMALQDLITRKVLQNEATRAGLKVTDDEVRDYIVSIAAFHNERGQFDPTVYEQTLRGSGRGLTAARFERDVRESLLIQRLQKLINHSVLVTEDQMRELYVAENDRVNLAFVEVTPESMKAGVRVTDAERQEYFDANQNRYRLPEMRSFAYVELSAGALAATRQVTEEDLRAAYESRVEDFRVEEEIEASHILLGVDDADEEEWESAREQAESIAREAQGGADFAALARRHSTDASADEGGHLGRFGRGAMVQAFEDTAFGLDAGEVSEPVRTRFGWHVIKVTDRREAGVLPFEEVQAGIERDLRQEQGAQLLAGIGEEIRDILVEGDIQTVADEYGLSVETTDLLRSNGRFPGVSDGQAVLETGFQLSEGQTSGVIDVNNNAKLIIQVREIQPARQQTLAEVRDRVDSALVAERADELASSRASDLREQAKKDGGFSGIRNVRVQETGFFSQLDRSVPEIGSSQELHQAAFRLQRHTPVPDRVFRVGGKYYVVALKERTEPDPEDFEEQRQELLSRLTEDKRQEVFSTWMQSAMSRAEVDTYLDAVQRDVPVRPMGF